MADFHGETSRADKSAWIKAGEIFQFWLSNQHLGYIAIERHFGFEKPYALRAMYAKFKKHSWNPLEDLRWLDWVQKPEKEY